MDKQITMRFWSVSPHDVPAGRAARIAWLYGWWRRIDDWIDANQPIPEPPPSRRSGWFWWPVRRG